MTANYVTVIRTLNRHREDARTQADDPDASPWIRANFNGQIFAYAGAVLAIHNTFNPYEPYSSELYQDDPGILPGPPQAPSGKVGMLARLDYPLSPFHGKVGVVTSVTTMHDGQDVYTVQWSESVQLSYVPARLTFEDAPVKEEASSEAFPRTGPGTYELARLRVGTTPRLLAYADLLLYQGWPEGEAHWEWVVDAPVAELVAWGEELMASGSGEVVQWLSGPIIRKHQEGTQTS